MYKPLTACKRHNLAVPKVRDNTGLRSPARGTAAYSASKSALFGLTRTMASELAANNITVNCIAPGYMDEGMIREIPEAMRAEIIAKTPVAKLSDTDGIVKMVELLLSNEANSITGQVLSVNGGLWM